VRQAECSFAICPVSWTMDIPSDPALRICSMEIVEIEFLKNCGIRFDELTLGWHARLNMLNISQTPGSESLELALLLKSREMLLIWTNANVIPSGRRTSEVVGPDCFQYNRAAHTHQTQSRPLGNSDAFRGGNY
jgi:hypothetical protein